jgi:uroporphyrinogen III methyltransferase/synthase
VVVHDRLIDPALLDMAPEGAERIDVGKRPNPPAQGDSPDSPDAPDGIRSAQGPERARPAEDAGSGGARQAAINALLIDRGRRGQTVVRLKGGDPFLFGRGGEEAEALERAGVPWEVVPGVTSALAVPAYAGIPVTHRGMSTSVTVVTGHVGDPTAPGGVDWEALARAGGTIVILMGMANRAQIASRLMAGGRVADTPVSVVQWGTTPAQRSEQSTLARLADVELGSPAVIVVGPVAALARGVHEHSSLLRPLTGRAVVLTRPRERSDELASALRAAGAQVIHLPTIVIAAPEDGGRSLDDAIRHLSRYNWVVFTSVNAVQRVMDRVPDARSFAGARVAAIGRATASALRAHGLVADLVPEHAGAAALAAEFPDAHPGGRVLFPRAARAEEVLPRGLRSRGWAVDEVIAYRTLPAALPEGSRIAPLASADAIVFASPSAVASFVAMRDAAGATLPMPHAIACIGPTTERAVRTSLADAGSDHRVEVAVTPTVPAIVHAVEAALGNHPRVVA